LSSAPAEVAFFEACTARALRAIENSRARHDIAIAGRVVRIVFASAALEAALWPALRDLATGPAATPELTLIAWDSRSTGLDPPDAPWDGEGFASWWRARAHRDHEVDAYLCGHGTFSLLDRRRRLGVYWVRSEAQVPPWDRAAPFRTLLGGWARDLDGALLHAAAVAHGDAAVLMTGKGGSGKSTTAMTCLLAGLGFIGEDYVLVDSPRAPRVHRLYATAKLGPDALARVFGEPASDAALPRLSPGPRPHDYGHDKHILLLDAHFTSRLLRQARVRAIVVPSVSSGARTSLTRLPAAAVVRALAPTTLLQLPFTGASTFARLSAMCQAVPGYALELGTDRGDIVAAVSGLLGKKD
jgi:hypothetical protein